MDKNTATLFKCINNVKVGAETNKKWQNETIKEKK
jgi:hypothetical protein